MAAEADYTLPDDSPLLWWQTGLIYQLYPRSFMDASGDGVGDLPGILQRLDYLAGLGVRCLWLSPVYPSPMYDFGYDVTDYQAIDPLFGRLADWDQLVSAVHGKGMKLVMDWVPNHTSHLHPWFVESRRNRDNPKRDWYLWRDGGPDGGPPNNWISFFGGSAWEYDPVSGQYYLHQFTREQPELNYRNPAVLAALLAAMRFWLERGVDGFRVDVIWLLLKEAGFRDEPVNPDWDGNNPHQRLHHIYTANQPGVHDIIRAFRALLDQYPERVMIGEIDLPPDSLMAYYGRARDECHLPTHFGLLHVPWRAAEVRRLISDYLRRLPAGAWPNWVLGNHDQRRLASRLGQAQARVATLLLLTLPGTPTWYYGDELGLENGLIPPDKVRDPQAVNQPEWAESLGRDPGRTPMQWDTSAHAGFSTVEPWLPLSPDHPHRNVATQKQQPGSCLDFFSRLLRLRQQEPALTEGSFRLWNDTNEEILAYSRVWQGKACVMLLNFSAKPHRFEHTELPKPGRKILSTHGDRSHPVTGLEGGLLLEPDEACIFVASSYSHPTPPP